jgi:DNA-binding LytR/AlgR family response regulator
MIKYIIVDDEPLAREGMQLNCEQVPYLSDSGSFANAILASDYLSKNEVDLIFLDIEMPGLNGLDFIRSMKKQPHVILCTAYPQYALESYELDVIDYLVKPIKFDRFFKAVSKVREYMELKELPNSDIDEYKETFMYIKSERKYVKVFYDDVLYIKGMKDYVVIHTKEKKYMTSMNVKTILSQLPPELFARISKSYIIQVKCIKSVDIDTIYTDTLELPLGPSYKEAFIEKFIKTNLVSR